MTINEFKCMIDLKKEYEFEYKGVFYNLTYGEDVDGNPYMCFGERYMGERYYTFGDLMASKIQNHSLKEFIAYL